VNPEEQAENRRLDRRLRLYLSLPGKLTGSETRSAAVSLLGYYGEADESALVRALWDPSEQVRQTAMSAIEEKFKTDPRSGPQVAAALTSFASEAGASHEAELLRKTFRRQPQGTKGATP
jgi:hypothetical protein